MSEKKSTAIRPEDWELLGNLAELQGRDRTEILHRALRLYLVSDEETQRAALAAPNKLTSVIRTALYTNPHKTPTTRAKPITKTTGRN